MVTPSSESNRSVVVRLPPGFTAAVTFTVWLPYAARGRYGQPVGTFVEVDHPIDIRQDIERDIAAFVVIPRLLALTPKY